MAIKKLEPLIVDQIAAGEVIERPASVVKEIVENALDAGARNILVEIEEGGGKLIRVRDDGGGITPDDLPLAFISHATSKLAAVEDLEMIASFGFRGEALASIGAVSRARITSRISGAAGGFVVSCEGGKLSDPRPVGCPEGTTVEVADLFFNTPARRKFLRTANAERGRIVDLISRLALVNPDVAWTLRSAGKELIAFPAGTAVRERIAIALGRDFEEALVPVASKRVDATVDGFVAAPEKITFRDSRRQLFFVNGRLVKDRNASAAVQKGLEQALMGGRKSGYVLFLWLPPEQVDVNVHPAKSEVRFRAPSLVFSLVREAVLPVAGRVGESLSGVKAPTPLSPPSAGRGAGSMPFAKEPGPALFPSDLNDRGGYFPSGADPFPPLPADNSPDSPALAGGDLFQVGGAFLVLPWQDGFAVVDQHALHEKVLYEKLLAGLTAGSGVPVQRLLAPVVVELTRAEKDQLMTVTEALTSLGFMVADFGPGAVAIEGVPAPLGRSDPADLLEEIISSLTTEGRVRSNKLEDRIASAACRAAVKSGDRLTKLEVAGLMRQASQLADGGHCPHGRPTLITFSREELERMFKRIV